MPLCEKLIQQEGIERLPVLDEETKDWRSGEKMFFAAESRLRPEGLKIIAPPGVNVYEKKFVRIVKRDSDRKTEMHLVFGATAIEAYLSVIKKQDVRADGTVVLANADYISGLDTIKFFKANARKTVAYINRFSVHSSRNPLAAEFPEKLDARDMLYIFIAYSDSGLPRDDRILHQGMNSLVQSHPKIKFDMFFSVQPGYPFSEKLDTARQSMIIAGIFEWVDIEATYRVSMNRESAKDDLRKRLGHHYDFLFRDLASDLGYRFNEIFREGKK